MPDKKSKPFGSGPLEKGKAKEKYDRFKIAFPETKFPVTVCYTINELRLYLNEAETALINSNIPTNERGIAMVLGLNDKDGTYAAEKVTIVLVATAFTDDGNCKVLTIDNPLTGKHGGAEINADEAIDDISYDTGSLFP